MGIPSLNSAILYCVSLYFHISSQETSRHHANITNIPDLVQENWRIVHENGGFYGYAHQNEPSVHKNRGFYGLTLKNMTPVHENSLFHGRELFILLYLCDALTTLEMTTLSVILSVVEGSLNEITN